MLVIVVLVLVVLVMVLVVVQGSDIYLVCYMVCCYDVVDSEVLVE